jgi:ATP-dependent Clp protease adaptor protein ClpS
MRFSWTKEEELTEVQDDVSGGYCIVLYNDDVNTFDHVISCLVRYCKHTPEQAEQCAVLVHFKGKCPVKQGSSEELVPICESLCKQMLSAKIEEA